MVESSLGKRWSLAGSTFVTALFCLAFVFSESSLAVRVSTIGISPQLDGKLDRLLTA